MNAKSPDSAAMRPSPPPQPAPERAEGVKPGSVEHAMFAVDTLRNLIEKLNGTQGSQGPALEPERPWTPTRFFHAVERDAGDVAIVENDATEFPSRAPSLSTIVEAPITAVPDYSGGQDENDDEEEWESSSGEDVANMYPDLKYKKKKYRLGCQDCHPEPPLRLDLLLTYEPRVNTMV